MDALVVPFFADVDVLFVADKSIYKTMKDVNAYDKDRDARTCPGILPAVAHPPCRTWGNLRTCVPVTWDTIDEHDLGPWAVDHIRRAGGVLEHPAGSRLFRHCRCGQSFAPDEWGGWTMDVDQFHWGHRAAKPTRLYVVGCSPADVPATPHRDGEPEFCITQGHGIREVDELFKSRLPDWERAATPPAFAQWLVTLARLCRHNKEVSVER